MILLRSFENRVFKQKKKMVFRAYADKSLVPRAHDLSDLWQGVLDPVDPCYRPEGS